MAKELKKEGWGSWLFHIPGNLLSGIMGYLLGYSTKEKAENDNGEEEEVEKEHYGLLSLILTGLKNTGVGFANVLANNKTATSIAAWASLIVGGAFALTLFLWPAALAAVVNYSLYGLSIAAATANPALQIAIAGGLAYAATSVLSWAGAILVSGITGLVNFCCPPQNQPLKKEVEEYLAFTSSHQSMMREMPYTTKSPTARKDEQPHHQPQKTEKERDTELDPENSNQSVLSGM